MTMGPYGSNSDNDHSAKDDNSQKATKTETVNGLAKMVIVNRPTKTETVNRPTKTDGKSNMGEDQIDPSVESPDLT